MKCVIWLYIFGYFLGCVADQERGPTHGNRCSGLKLVPRKAWHARPPVRKFPMDLPVSHVIIIHTVFGACKNLHACIRNIQFMQDYHMDDKGWWNIAYNFLIGGDGRVYEGVGWQYTAEHTINYNTISIGLAFIGNYSDVAPSEEMLHAAKTLIACGIKMGYLTPSVQISGHRDATCTSSPGNRLYEIIKQWPNFKGGRLPLYHCDAQAVTPRVTED